MGRKYTQKGYMDTDREERERRPREKSETFGPRTPVMPGQRAVWRCASCAAILPAGTDPQGKCPQCGIELHCCKQCSFFDTASRFECTKPITARIPKKDARNECSFFAPRTTIERETSSSKPLDARAAFENLFKK
jgi:predicted RNA-binding Zn-ribbon protein involved in translation (DUF1610 family)